MIDWLDQRCLSWGYSQRWLAGYTPPSSVFGRITDGWSIAAAEGSERPCPPEVHQGHALMVNNAIRRALAAGAMTERLHEILRAHYVYVDPIKQKQADLNLSARRYYKRLHRAHLVLKEFIGEGEGAQQSETRVA